MLKHGKKDLLEVKQCCLVPGFNLSTTTKAVDFYPGATYVCVTRPKVINVHKECQGLKTPAKIILKFKKYCWKTKVNNWKSC